MNSSKIAAMSLSLSLALLGMVSAEGVAPGKEYVSNFGSGHGKQLYVPWLCSLMPHLPICERKK